MLSTLRRQYPVYDHKVGHVYNEEAYGETEVPNVAASDALTVEDAVMVQIIDADIAEVAMDATCVHIDITLVAGVVPFRVLAWKDLDTGVGPGLKLVDLVWNARIAEQAHEETEKASQNDKSATKLIEPGCVHAM